jgi:hypothetical protein
MTDAATEKPSNGPTDLLWGHLKRFHTVHRMAIGTDLDLFGKIQQAGEGGCNPADLAADLG